MSEGIPTIPITVRRRFYVALINGAADALERGTNVHIVIARLRELAQRVDQERFYTDLDLRAMVAVLVELHDQRLQREIRIRTEVRSTAKLCWLCGQRHDAPTCPKKLCWLCGQRHDTPACPGESQ